MFDEFFECDGEGFYGDDEGMVGGIGRFKGVGVRVIGDEGGKERKEKLGGNLGMGDGEG
ncbi:hypothetical protein [Bacillus altitudinis]|uniref:hypothetical protein n=1 Tax=Bacillus altitudinis TaxID=293387 RepID=UPI001643B11A|nr:hypothetical protein [Bacillus altitudinis]